MNLKDKRHLQNLIETEKSMKYQVEHDFLTDTLNRRELLSSLEDIFTQSKKNKHLNAYLFLDLDRFKSINDRYGHDTGDKLLVELVKRIRPLLNKEDIFARMSGDEFAIILKNIEGTSSDGLNVMRRVNEVCAKLSSELSRPFILNQYEISTSASVGVRLFPDDAKKASDVMLHADAAMYRSKKKMKGSMTLFDENLAQEFQEQNLLKEDLERAYLNNEYVFFFQPKVDVITNAIKGVEILVRWLHPTRGLLFPDEFLKEAIDIGMLPKIIDLSIRRACEFIASTKEYFSGSIAINVSSAEIIDTFFISHLAAIIKEYDIDAKRIELEIVEDELIKNFEFAIILIKKLQKLGIRISIDDFGTGYSSITYLQKLPVNTLKIDRAFIKNLHTSNSKDRDLILVETITNMAKAFNIDIVAEGVENEAQLAIVKKLGIEEYQGFLFSEAVEEEAFLELIRSNKT